MDIRHPLKELDWQLIEWTKTCELPLHILLTKSDKLSRQETRKTEDSVKSALQDHQHDAVTVQIFSSNDRSGLPDALKLLNGWLVN